MEMHELYLCNSSAIECYCNAGIYGVQYPQRERANARDHHKRVRERAAGQHSSRNRCAHRRNCKLPEITLRDCLGEVRVGLHTLIVIRRATIDMSSVVESELH